MKKMLILFIMSFALVGCNIGPANTPSKAVEEYLERYVSNDDAIMNELDEYVINNQELSDNQKKTYKEILKKQYSDMKYEITNEQYDGDNAIVVVKITVYDLYKVQKESDEYLSNNADKFKNEEGTYDSSKYTDYKLQQMKSTSETIDYTLDISVIKINNIWEVTQLSHDSLQKIHGVYNYQIEEN